MTTQPVPPAPIFNHEDALDEAIESWLYAKDLAKKYADERDAAARTIARLVPPGTTVGPVRVSPPRRLFDPKLAEQELTPDEFASICELKPSVTLAQQKLTGEQLERIYSATGRPSVQLA